MDAKSESVPLDKFLELQNQFLQLQALLEQFLHVPVASLQKDQTVVKLPDEAAAKLLAQPEELALLTLI
jgi:hypothetical protein